MSYVRFDHLCLVLYFSLMFINRGGYKGGLGGPDPTFSTAHWSEQALYSPGGFSSFYRAQAALHIPRFSLV